MSITKVKNLTGLVVSQGKLSKTVKVRIQTKSYDKRIQKDVLHRKDYLVHDEGELCREGDIVRIQQIPKISARKLFAIAEIKSNVGQKFAEYEVLAKEKIAQEEEEKLREFVEQKEEYKSLVDKIEDLRKLDTIASKVASSEDKKSLIDQIEEIKSRYSIDTWPSTKHVLPLDLTAKVHEFNAKSVELSEIDVRIAKFNQIKEDIFESKYDSIRNEILKSMNSTTNSKSTSKNIIRKFLLNPKNEWPKELEV